MIDPRQTAEAITAGDAMITLMTPGARPLEVRLGFFEWTGPRSVFYFELGGDTEFHGHVLEFDQATAPHELGVSFEKDGRMIAYLSPLLEMEYEVNVVRGHIAAFALWREHLAANPDLLTFITGLRDRYTQKEAE